MPSIFFSRVFFLPSLSPSLQPTDSSLSLPWVFLPDAAQPPSPSPPLPKAPPPHDVAGPTTSDSPPQISSLKQARSFSLPFPRAAHRHLLRHHEWLPCRRVTLGPFPLSPSTSRQRSLSLSPPRISTDPCTRA